MVKYWILGDDINRKPSNDEISAGYQALDLMRETTGVEYFRINLESYEEEGSFYQKLKSERGFTYEDVVDLKKSDDSDYDKQAKEFFHEHLHEDDEIRFVVSGSGYFDVRDINDTWIRVQVTSGDLLIIPAGIYHRFSLDEEEEKYCVC